MRLLFNLCQSDTIKYSITTTCLLSFIKRHRFVCRFDLHSICSLVSSPPSFLHVLELFVLNTVPVCPDRSEVRLVAVVVLEDEVSRLLVEVAVVGEVGHVTDDLSSVVGMDPMVVSQQDGPDLPPDLGVVSHPVVS